MIVNVAAWIFIVQAILGLGSLFLGPFGFGASKETLATLLVSGLLIAMGVGLLKRLTWARWFALGISLIGWTLGTIGLIAIAVGIVALVAAGGAMVMLAIGMFVLLVVSLVLVVIDFKLFFYLCSRDGCEEFGVSYGSASTVVASVGAWIAIAVAQVYMSSGGLLPLLMAQAMQGRDHDSQAQRRELELRRMQEQQREQALAQERQREAAPPAADEMPPAEAPPAPVESEPATETYTAEEAPAPALVAEEEEKPSSSTILKCRDASGAVMFTQGYCPPGTQRVDSPKNE